jgi:hypothetical protein
MQKKLISAAALGLLLLAAGTAAAGTVYLPQAMNQTIDGRVYRTILWATNNANQAAKAEVRFIPTFTDGVEGGEVVTVNVPPRATVPVGTPFTGVGMAEIVADDSVFFVAELKSFDADGQPGSSTSVSLVDAVNLIPADGEAQLLALERQTVGSMTTLGIVNLNTDSTECTVKAYRPQGSQIMSTALLQVPALGQREFPDTFGILGEPSIDGGRFVVSCDAPFYSYATVLGSIPDTTHFVTPAAGGADGLKTRLSGGELVNLPGTYFVATIANPLLEILLPIEPGQRYESITIDFDMRTARWPTDLFIGTVGLLRPVTGGLYWNHTIRAGRQRSVLDMGVGDSLVHRGATGLWSQNQNYHVQAVYDTGTGFITFRTFQGGQMIEEIVGALARFDISHNGEGIYVTFGLRKVFDNAFFPPYDFRFSNLVVEGVPALE